MALFGSFREQPLTAILTEFVPAELREFAPTPLFAACAITAVCSLLLGGGTRGGFLSDAVLELIAIPALLLAVASLVDLPTWRTETRTNVYWVLAFCFAVAFLPLIQLVPLPPWLWTRLPGRDGLAKVFDLFGEPPWMPISVSPYSTWLSFLSLLPPMAIFLAAVQLPYRDRRRLTLIVIAMAVLSAFLGLVQVAQGPTGSLRFFTITNPTEAVGFFANRNDFAALLYSSLPFAAAWVIDVAYKRASWENLKRHAPMMLVALTASLLVLIVLLAAEGMARSRAGIVLSIVALGGVFAMVFADRRNANEASTDGGGVAGKWLLAAVVLALLFIIQFGLYRIAERFPDPLEGARLVFAHNTIHAAMAFMPFGSGLGTFVPVYAMFERAADTIPGAYVNRAHNDVLEWWLETGAVGILLMVAFLILFGSAAINAWRRPVAGASNLDRSLMRAATITVCLLIAHSFVDYPLRTEAIMAVFAMSCALLIEPLQGEAAEMKVAAGRRAVSPVRAAPPLPPRPAVSSSPASGRPAITAESSPARAHQSAARWGEDIDWPDEWRKPEKSQRSGTAKLETGTKNSPESDPNG